jgi:protein CpxP
MKKTTIALLLTVGLGTALFAFGPGGHGCGPNGGHGSIYKVIKELDLTSKQKEALKKLKSSNRDEMKSTMKEMRKNMRANMQNMKPDLSTFMTADSFDKEAFKEQMNGKFEEKRKKMEEKKEQMLEKKATSMEQIFNILTPEQRIKWIELSKETDKR